MSGRIDPSSVSIRIAEGAERRACRMLLADLDRLGDAGGLWLATTSAMGPVVVGALSLHPARDADGRGTAIASARVVRSWRRGGVGTMLLDVAIAESGRCGAVALVVRIDPLAAPDGVLFLEARGFRRDETLTTVEVPTAGIVEYLAPLEARLREADLIPGDARMRPLREAPIAEVARLHAEHLSGTEEGVAEMLRGLLLRADADDHAVLMIGDEVRGFLLGTTVDGVTTVDVEILSPECRISGGSSGWASVFMLSERLSWAISRGSRVTRFSSVSTNRPTRRIAARLGARPVAEQVVYRLDLLESA